MGEQDKYAAYSPGTRVRLTAPIRGINDGMQPPIGTIGTVVRFDEVFITSWIDGGCGAVVVKFDSVGQTEPPTLDGWYVEPDENIELAEPPTCYIPIFTPRRKLILS